MVGVLVVVRRLRAGRVAGSGLELACQGRAVSLFRCLLVRWRAALDRGQLAAWPGLAVSRPASWTAVSRRLS